MQRVQTGPLVGLAGVVTLLVALDAATGLGTRSWAVGVTCGTVAMGLLDRALEASDHRLGPADRVTLVRTVLACGVTALVAQPGNGRGWLVALAVLALVLDGLDGLVARRTATASGFGARFDMEVDAFLILVLSVHVAGPVGVWVLLIGAARYVLLAAASVLPWLRATLPPRPWCKVVAVVQGVVLVMASAALTGAVRLALVVALVLLAESFGREVRDLWRLHSLPPVRAREVDRVG